MADLHPDSGILNDGPARGRIGGTAASTGCHPQEEEETEG